MKSFFGFIGIVAVVLGLSIMAAHSVQHNGLPDLLAIYLPKYFDKDYGLPDPGLTLQAPFIDKKMAAKAPEDNALGIRYEPEKGINVETDLTQPHRAKEEIAEWLIKALSEILDIDAAGYTQHLKFLETGLDPYALTAYDTFMKESGIIGSLQGNNLKLRSYVEESPMLLNSGVLEGRYRWLFEVPVTLSFLPKDLKTYKGFESKDIPNEYIIIKLQVGRAEGNPGAQGVLIETWDIRRNKMKTEEKKAPPPAP